MRLIYIIFEMNLPYITCEINHFAGSMLYYEVAFVKGKDTYVSPA